MNFTPYALALFGILAALFFLIIVLNKKMHLLRDDIGNCGTTNPSPNGGPVILQTYSLASVQLAWWTLIIIPCFVTTVIYSGEIPQLTEGLLILLGITGGTAAFSKAVDGSAAPILPPNTVSPTPVQTKSLLSDILSTGEGAGVHRLQVIIFNLTFGIWFISKTLMNLADNKDKTDILPSIHAESLAVLGISAAIYTTMKASEKKPG